MTRAVAPLVGTLAVVAITVVLAAAVTSATLGVPTGIEGPPPLAVSLTATADGRLALVHEAGPPLDVREIDVRIAVDGTPLERQPPVPFFSAAGFASGPTGPFNPASDPIWAGGERATLRIASTNEPDLVVGATVTVRLVRDGSVVLRAERTVARATE